MSDKLECILLFNDAKEKKRKFTKFVQTFIYDHNFANIPFRFLFVFQISNKKFCMQNKLFATKKKEERRNGEAEMDDGICVNHPKNLKRIVFLFEIFYLQELKFSSTAKE